VGRGGLGVGGTFALSALVEGGEIGNMKGCMYVWMDMYGWIRCHGVSLVSHDVHESQKRTGWDGMEYLLIGVNMKLWSYAYPSYLTLF